MGSIPSSKIALNLTAMRFRSTLSEGLKALLNLSLVTNEYYCSEVTLRLISKTKIVIATSQTGSDDI